MKKWAILVAGGKGLRMGTEIPKQFLEIEGTPIIVRTIERFRAYDPNIRLVIVIPRDQSEAWHAIKQTFLPKQQIVLAFGGKTRSESVQNGLEHVDQGLVSIHDAVRPFVEVQTIADSFESAYKNGSGVPVVDLKDSIRELTGQGSMSRDRTNYRLVQTPQTFRVSEIKEAYAKANQEDFLDDASVYEAAGFNVSLVSGSYGNIKITTQEDLN